MGSCGGFGGTWSATPLACHVCAEMGGWLRRSCWCPTFPAPSPGPSHGPGRGVERSLAATSTPPLPRPSTYLGVGAVRVAMQVGVLGAFRVASSPFPPHCFTLLFQRINCEAQGCSVSFRSRGHQFCSSHAPCLLSDLFRPADCPVCCGWLRLILPEGGVPCFTGEAYADLKECVVEGFEVSPTQPLPSVLGGPVSGFSAGPRQVVHLLLVSHLPTPCLCFHELGVDRTDGGARSGGPPQSLTMTATPRSRTCRLGLWLLRLVRRLLGLPHPHLLCPRGFVGLDVFSELLHGKNGGPLNFWVPFPTQRRRRSPSPASLSPVPPSESVVVEDDYLVCSDGEEDAALPVPKRTTVRGLPPPGFLSAGPFLRLFF
ncbi:hypothetical protein GWK47_025793 [Chionoecetes opilio]|uniref:Uncharacterized protein n=1 Tax=Chionoecetes opilio TaxID=41210 RepID=A0A8J8WD07_CHIOP|nr:hypothetical protein GWK47_025793 [Chionoecetes opilio]